MEWTYHTVRILLYSTCTNRLKMVKKAPTTSSSSASGASKKEAFAKRPAKNEAVKLTSEQLKTRDSKSSAPSSKKRNARDSKSSAAAQDAGLSSEKLGKAAEKSKSATKATESGKDAETREADDDEDEGALKSEVQGFLDGFNYDTDSDISEPEGLDDIDD